ncbi:hypothetical protein QJS66_09275 [Kocuria rhizophila]|nr:hypothetical protein QJS66_09275 [Kocuria rhizophila]
MSIVPQRPFLFSGTSEQPALRRGRRGRGAVGGPARGAGGGLRAGHAQVSTPVSGRTDSLRAVSASGSALPVPSWRARRLRLRRLLLRTGRGHRRPTSRGAGPVRRGRRVVARGPARLHHRARQDSWSCDGAACRPPGRPAELVASGATYRKSSPPAVGSRSTGGALSASPGTARKPQFSALGRAAHEAAHAAQGSPHRGGPGRGRARWSWACGRRACWDVRST